MLRIGNLIQLLWKLCVSLCVFQWYLILQIYVFLYFSYIFPKLFLVVSIITHMLLICNIPNAIGQSLNNTAQLMVGSYLNRRESGLKWKGFGYWLLGMSWDGQFGRSCEKMKREVVAATQVGAEPARPGEMDASNAQLPVLKGTLLWFCNHRNFTAVTKCVLLLYLDVV